MKSSRSRGDDSITTTLVLAPLSTRLQGRETRAYTQRLDDQPAPTQLVSPAEPARCPSSSSTANDMASTSSDLTTHTRSCVVHPLVLLSIQDHYHRVAKNSRNKRVVGILLGQDLGAARGGYNISNSFAVPFEEDDKDPRTWFLDHNYIEAMNDMFKKVNGPSPCFPFKSSASR